MNGKNIEKNNVICEKCLIRSKSAFSHLTNKEYQKLYQEKSCLFFRRGEIIFYEGHRLRGVYCLQKGALKLYKTGHEGKEQIIRLAKPGDLLAFRAILTQEKSCTTAQAIEDSLLCHIPAKTFIEIAKENPEFSLKLIQISCKELEESNKLIVDLAQRPVKDRLIQTLFLLQDTFSTDSKGFINIQLTREEIANIVGTATENMIRILSDLKKKQLIELSGKKIKILKPEILEKTLNL